MARSEPKITEFNELRKRAEKKVLKSNHPAPKPSLTDIEKLVHELRVHQIELEMQNDELRRSQQELMEERLGYADLYDFAPVGYFTLDRKGRIVEVNHKGALLLGSGRRLLTGQQFQWFVPRSHLAAFESLLKAAMENEREQTCKLRLTRKGGDRFDILMGTIAIKDKRGNFLHFRSTVSDITEIAAAEEKLQQAQELYRSIVDNVGIGIVMIGKDMKVMAMNRQMQEWFPHVDVSMRPTCYKVFHDPSMSRAPSSCPVYQTLNDGLRHEAVVNTNGEAGVRYLRSVSTPVRDRDGNVISAIKMGEDITEHVMFQRRLRESEDKYRTIFETTGSATIIVEGDGTVSLVNSTFEEWSGYSRDEIEGRATWKDLVAEDDIERIDGYRRLRKINPDAAPKAYDLRCRKKDGDIRDAIATVDAIPGTGRVVVSLLDITEIKRAEELLKKREKDLEAKSKSLEEANITLKVMLARREEDKRDLEENILANVKQLIMPHVEKMRNCPAKERGRHVAVIESKLKDIISPFANMLTSKGLGLTAKEVEVAYLIRSGFTTKQIADSLHISRGTVEFHRENIRSKLYLKNKKTNLKSFLLTLS